MMGLVNKIFGRGHDRATNGRKGSGADRLAADRARQLSIPQAESLTNQAAVRAHMEQELADQRAHREASQAAPTD
jgi:hypothetical protein